MTVGNVAALRQNAARARSAVRLLAWSSVAQAGYLLVPDRRRRVLQRRTDRLHRRVRPHVRRREPGRVRGRRPRRPYAPRQPALRLPGPVRHPAPRRPGPRVLPALPGRTAARHHRALREGDRLLGGGRRGPRLARRRHGRQRGDRSLLLPSVDRDPLPRTGRSPGNGRTGHRVPGLRRTPRRFRVPTPLTTAIVLTSAAGILLSGVRRPFCASPPSASSEGIRPARSVCPRRTPQGMVLAAYVMYSAWTRRENEEREQC